MLKKLIFRALPVLLLGSLTLSSCVIHEHERGPRGPRGYHGYHGRPGPGSYGPGRGY